MNSHKSKYYYNFQFYMESMRPHVRTRAGVAGRLYQRRADKVLVNGCCLIKHQLDSQGLAGIFGLGPTIVAGGIGGAVQPYPRNLQIKIGS